MIKIPLFFRQTSGSAIVEVLVAFFILTLALTGSLSVLVTVIQSNTTQKNRFVAMNLAEEGLEVVRNMRDANWMRFSANLRECWHFWDDTNEDGVIDDNDTSCPPPASSVPHPMGLASDGSRPHHFLVDLDPETFRWVLVSEESFPGITARDYETDHFRLYSATFSGGGKTFFTHDRGGDSDPHETTPFFRSVALYYPDTETDFDATQSPITGGDYPSSSPAAADNRMLVVVRVWWNERGAEREVVLSTILTDFLGRNEWNS